MCRAIGFRERSHSVDMKLHYPAHATFPRCTPSRVFGIIPSLAETPTPQLKRGLAVARTGNSIRCTCIYGRPRTGSPSSSDGSSRGRCGIIRSGTTTGGRMKKSIWTDKRIAAVMARNRVERIYRCRRHGADALGFRKGDTFVVAAGSVCGPRDTRRAATVPLRWRDALERLGAIQGGALTDDEKFTTASTAASAVAGIRCDGHAWREVRTAQTADRKRRSPRKTGPKTHPKDS